LLSRDEKFTCERSVCRGRCVGELEIARPRHIWEDIIKVDHAALGYVGADGVNLTEAIAQ
jgi:hypothetical protein